MNYILHTNQFAPATTGDQHGHSIFSECGKEILPGRLIGFHFYTTILITE